MRYIHQLKDWPSFRWDAGDADALDKTVPKSDKVEHPKGGSQGPRGTTP